MIILLGESASGKSSVMKRFIKKYPEFHPVIPYTTRPKRYGEINGIDYHFISEDAFITYIEKGMFIESAEYNNWSYGTLKDDYFKDSEHTIAICTPCAFRKIKDKIILENLILGSWISSFYLSVPRRDRLIKLLKRGDDLEEAYRRNLSEVGQFDGIENEVYKTIYNPGYEKSIDEIVDCIHLMVKGGYYE